MAVEPNYFAFPLFFADIIAGIFLWCKSKRLLNLLFFHSSEYIGVFSIKISFVNDKSDSLLLVGLSSSPKFFLDSLSFH